MSKSLLRMGKELMLQLKLSSHRILLHTEPSQLLMIFQNQPWTSKELVLETLFLEMWRSTEAKKLSDKAPLGSIIYCLISDHRCVYKAKLTSDIDGSTYALKRIKMDHEKEGVITSHNLTLNFTVPNYSYARDKDP